MTLARANDPLHSPVRIDIIAPGGIGQAELIEIVTDGHAISVVRPIPPAPS
jgi:hypothetical protein